MNQLPPPLAVVVDCMYIANGESKSVGGECKDLDLNQIENDDVSQNDESNTGNELGDITGSEGTGNAETIDNNENAETSPEEVESEDMSPAESQPNFEPTPTE